MEKVKTIFYYLLLPLIILLLIYYYFKDDDKNHQSYSEDSHVNNAINVIGDSLGKIGFFNSHHEVIFSILQNMNPLQISQLHTDFGHRFYNSLTGMYKILNTSSWGGFTEKRNLTAIYLNEFDEKQKDRLKKIYLSKGVSHLLGF